MKTFKKEYPLISSNAKILHLPIKKRWFDMIKSRQKNVEYRAFKRYWILRLIKNYKRVPNRFGKFEIVIPESIIYNDFDYIYFKNGYSFESPTLLVECNRIDLGIGRAMFGAVKGEIYFRIFLGRHICKGI
jgi:hypothetical protein